MFLYLKMQIAFFYFCMLFSSGKKLYSALTHTIFENDYS